MVGSADPEDSTSPYLPLPRTLKATATPCMVSAGHAAPMAVRGLGTGALQHRLAPGTGLIQAPSAAAADSANGTSGSFSPIGFSFPFLWVTPHTAPQPSSGSSEGIHSTPHTIASVLWDTTASGQSDMLSVSPTMGEPRWAYRGRKGGGGLG